MREPFALANFLSRWIPDVRHDLASSDSETTTLSDLLDLAGPDDLDRWRGMGFGYLDPRGADWLRGAVAGRYERLEADDVLCCAGAQEALACVVAALLTPEDHAVVVLPIYQPSEEAVTALCAATGVALREADGWGLDVGEVAAALRPETKLVLMNIPNSPTGAVLDAATMGDLVALCRRRGLWLVSDEVYRHTQGRDAAPTVADLYERGISIDSLSKGFGLAGLRVGWIGCRDRRLLAAALNAKNRMSSCLAAPSEILAHIALKAGNRILTRSRAIGERSRARLAALIDRHPDRFEADASHNLAYAFPRYRGGEGADRFAHDLARRGGILILPASLWRSPLGEIQTDRLRIGLGRLGAFDAFEALDEHLRVPAPHHAMVG